ncbi:GNAT family N-acetyltransferase [Kutzneria sp. NPDC052558]|uniref:GNAT family N-acetyltransferase n=1 Tax=Kutzneria sp. NPDC052558 TaxID=3364121 RepID=UPI0037C83E54
MRWLRFDELGPRELDAWHAIRSANPALDSPYFHPGFAAAVHASGRTVHVAVDTDDAGRVRALLPGHRAGSTLRPVGWPGADFQGPIVRPGESFSPLTLLSAGVRSFEFDHLVDGVAEFEPWIRSRRVSPHVDVSGGLDGYLGRASKSGRDNISQARRRAAKAERELGPVKFQVDVVDEELLGQLVELKRGQYRATGARDFFAEPDRLNLLRRLLHTRDEGFGGLLSTLHAGPNLIAAHFGIRSDSVLHWWFPVYAPEHGRLAPGWMLLRELVVAAPALGIDRIDLGRGDDEYKRRAKTGETQVGQGIVTRSGGRLALRRVADGMVAAAKSSPLAPGLRRVARGLRNLRR